MASIKSQIAALSYAIVLCGIVPLFPWLTGAPRAVLVAGMAAGIWQDFRGSWPIKNWVYNAAVVPVFLYYAIQYSRANPVQPVLSVLSIMLAVRLGGEKSGRYYLQIQALSLFCLAASSLFDLSPAFLVYLTMMLMLVAVALVLLTFYAQDSRMVLSSADLRRVVAAGLFMPLASLPLLAIFFPILPRTQLPLWNFLSPVAERTGGMADKVEPGRSANVAESPVLAFRAETTRLPQQQLYWRGKVFNRIAGNRWIRDEKAPFEQTGHPGARISQTIYPEPGLSRTIFALDAPAAVMLPRTKRSPDGTYELQGPAVKRLSYRVESATSGILPIRNRIDRDFYLRLPADVPTRILHLADDIRRRADSDVRRVELLKQYFRQGNYRYSLRDLPTGENALEQFLFEKKQGQCEFFASSFALLLRAAGVPARLVGGYLGGEYNDIGGYYLVTEDRAHVWVEALIAGKGWVRIDPSGFARNAGAIWGGPKKRDLLTRLRLTLDSLNHTWNRSIITYDFERQVDAARSMGQRLQGFNPWRALKRVLPVMLFLSGLAGLFILVSRRKLLLPTREERLLKRFYRRVAADSGVQFERGRHGLFEMAEASQNPRVREFAEIYAGAVYRDRRLTSEEYGRLTRMLKEGF